MFSGLAIVAGTLGWFVPLAKITKEDNRLSGSSSGAYFAYGNGIPTTPEHPENRVYGITAPRHLYNLAWLQYLGFFNNESENGKQYYFELGDNIDMTGWTLPPIGTEEFPFIGNFNGNGYVIKGLTVSNNFNDFNRHPGVVQSDDFTQPHIMGFFGVVGDYNGDFASTDYSSAANEFSNTGLTGLTIKTYLRDSLMGVAAGYVDAKMKNVAVDASTISLDSSITGTTTSYGGFTNNISDFSLVGYTTNKKQVKKVDETIYDINVDSGYEFNATEQGDTTGWGGSIDMMSVMQRLQSIRNNSSSVAFDYKRTYNYHKNNQGSYTKDATYTANATMAANAANKTYIINNNDEHGHFNIICDQGYEENYALLGGGHYETSKYYDPATHNGYKLTDGKGHYLSATSFTNNAATVTNADSAGACVWSAPTGATGRISTQYYYDPDGNISTYYLRVVNNTQLQLTTTQANGTTFTRETEVIDGQTFVRFEYNGYYLNYNGSSWTMTPIPTFTQPYPDDPSTYIPTHPGSAPSEPTTPEPQAPTTPEPQIQDYGGWGAPEFNVANNSYQIAYTNNGTTYYLVPSGTNTYTTSTTPFYGWTIGGLSGSQTISTLINNRTYYLYPGNGALSLSITSRNWTIATSGNGYRLSYTRNNGTTYYLKFTNNAFGYSTGNSNNTISLTETSSIVNEHNSDPSIANPYNTAHDAWQAEQTAYQTAHDAWQAEQTAYQTAHDAWQAEQTAYQTAHQAWEDEWTQYYQDYEDWEDEMDQYNQDYATYENYRDNIYPGLVEEYNDARDQYLSDLSATHNIESSNQTTVTGPDEHLVNTKTGMNYDEDDVTYFPLSTVNGYQDLRPADNNTAYIVAGANITASTTNNNYSDTLSRVRFGRFNIANSITSGDFTSNTGTWNKVYTVNDSLQREDISNSTAYEKLADAKKNLGSVMKNQTYVYGLHFMDAAISMDALTVAKYVKVNKEVYRDYELPVNSINFHLKEFGYINFMAGTYYNNSATDRNDSFFALYQVERLDSNPNKINRIFEILNVYKHTSGTKNYSYVYQLRDIVAGTTLYTKPYKVVDAEGNKEWLYDTETAYSNNQYVNSLPQNYTLAFNCARIKKNSIDRNTFVKHAFYFEIPMNDGEFCLGSVSGATGAYLMYLDIGANAAKVQRTIFREHFSYVENISVYPDGVALVTLPTTFTKEVAILDPTNPIDCMDSACVEIHSGYTNVFTIDRDVGDVTLTVSNQSNAPPIYKGEEITLIHTSGSSTNIPVVPISNDTKEITRLTYYDVNVNLGALTRTIVTDTSVNGGTATRTITQEIFAGTDASATPTTTYVYDSTTDQRDDMRVYNTSNGVRLSSAELLSTTYLPIGTVSNTAILTVRIVQDGGAGFEEEISLNAVIDDTNLNGKYYIFDDYVITITPDGADVVIYIQSYSSGKTIYYGTTQVTGANQTITITV